MVHLAPIYRTLVFDKTFKWHVSVTRVAKLRCVFENCSEMNVISLTLSSESSFYAN